MFFPLSKIFWMLVSPGNLLLLIAVGGVGVVLISRRRKRLGVGIASFAVFIMLVVAALPIGENLLLPLENRFPPPHALPEKVDGIIVLGGAADPYLSRDRNQPHVGEAGERLFALLELGQKYPQAKVVFTSGSGSLYDQSVREADTVRDLYASIGVDTSRIVWERDSRNTRENAEFSKKLANPQKGETWLLVTSAFHMPRSVGVFRAADWPVIAWPVDYRTSPKQAQSFSFGYVPRMGMVELAVHEWIGLAAYHLYGWTDAWLPSP